MKQIVYCEPCGRYEHAEITGPFFLKCTECLSLIARDLDKRPSHRPYHPPTDRQ